jgi:LacI family transcriptional regulator
MTTIKDIARLAGVSYSTVSKALNNSPLVREDTKRKILEIALKNNYKRNLLARQLVSGRSKLVGLVLKDVGNPLFSYLATQIHASLRSMGYEMILTLSSEGIGLLENLRVDGLLYWGHVDPDSNEAQKLGNLAVPVVTLGNDMEVDLPSLKVNRKGGISTAVKYLYDNGHQRIGLIGNSQEIKTQLFKESILEAGLQFRAEYVLPGQTKWDGGYEAMKTFTFSEESPTAFIGVNNLVTMGALRALLERGIAVPSDISLVGYDDLPEMERTEIPITTIGPPIDEMARVAAHMILNLIEGKTLHSETWIQPVLHARKSSGRRFPT